MKYYKVKTESDQKQVINKSLSNGKMKIKATLIASELFTENELKRKLNLSEQFTPNFINTHFSSLL